MDRHQAIEQLKAAIGLDAFAAFSPPVKQRLIVNAVDAVELPAKVAAARTADAKAAVEAERKAIDAALAEVAQATGVDVAPIVWKIAQPLAVAEPIAAPPVVATK